jgi:hypothetical protein
LDTTVSYLAYLITIKLWPFLSVEFAKEFRNVKWIDEVNECITHIAFVLLVNWQVKEIVESCLAKVDCLQYHLLCIFVGYVPYHNGRSAILTVYDLLNLQCVIAVIFCVFALITTIGM